MVNFSMGNFGKQQSFFFSPWGISSYVTMTSNEANDIRFFPTLHPKRMLCDFGERVRNSTKRRTALRQQQTHIEQSTVIMTVI